MSRRDNLRTGFRRLSIVTGILGAIIGAGIGAVDASGNDPVPIMFGALAGAAIGWGVVFGPYWVYLGFLGDEAGKKPAKRDDEVV